MKPFRGWSKNPLSASPRRGPRSHPPKAGTASALSNSLIALSIPIRRVPHRTGLDRSTRFPTNLPDLSAHYGAVAVTIRTEMVPTAARLYGDPYTQQQQRRRSSLFVKSLAGCLLDESAVVRRILHVDYVIVRPLSTVEYTSVASVFHSRQSSFMTVVVVLCSHSRL